MQVTIHVGRAVRDLALAAMLALAVLVLVAHPAQALADTAGTAGDVAADASSQATGDSTGNLAAGSQAEADSAKEVAAKPFKKPGVYFVTLAKNSKKALGMDGAKRVEGAGVAVAKKANTNLLRFKVSSAGGGLYYIKNIATGRLLTAAPNVKGTSGTVHMNAKYETSKDVAKYQKWQIVVNSDKSVSISHPKTGLRLSLAGKKTAVGTKLKLAKASATPRAAWRLRTSVSS